MEALYYAVTRYLAKEMVSFNTIEKNAFKAMAFDKQYELLGRKFFSKTTVPKLYNIRINSKAYQSEWTLKLKCLQTSLMPETWKRHCGGPHMTGKKKSPA